MNYVAHDCRNTRNGSCNNRWVDKDLTGATTNIPTWKYCRECCEKLGIDFDRQRPNDYLTDEQLETKNKRIEKMKSNRKKKID